MTQLIWFIVMFIISYYTSSQMMKNKQKRDPLSEQDVDLPQVDEGTAQAVLHGDCWTAGWTVLGWGNLRNKGISSHGQVAWYEYYMSLLIGLWRGPVNHVRYITANEIYILKTNVTLSQRILINAPDAFGGNTKQGGYQGYLDLRFGEASQMPNTSAGTALGHPLPAFRGRTYGFFDGLVAANSLSPYPWIVRGDRTTAGWANDDCWYPETCTIMLENQHDAFAMSPGANQYDYAHNQIARNIYAKNFVHVLYEAYTDPVWGKGKDRSLLNDEIWRAAALTASREGFGICANWQISDDVDSFIQSICDHGGAGIYASIVDNKIAIKLFRDDYNPNTLRTYGPGTGLVSIDEINESALSEAVSEIIVKWKDPLTNQERSTRQQNLGLLQAAPVISKTVSYPFLPTIELANRVASRDLRAQGLGTRRYVLTLDRSGADLEPGMVIAITSPAHGVLRDILRIVDIDYGSSDDGHVKVTGVQDVFGLPATSYALPQGAGWTPPTNKPGVITDFLVFERTYRDLLVQLGQPTVDALPQGSGYISTVAVKPTEACTYYALQTKRVSDSAYILSPNQGPFTERGVASAAITTRLPFTVTLGDIDTTRIAIGSLCLWDQEILQVTSIVDQTVGLERGCLDTVPTLHDAGSSVWFYDNETGDVDRSFGAETVKLQMIAFAGTTGVDSSLVPVQNFPVSGRITLPYPPGNVLVGDYPFGEGGLASAGDTLSWVNRNRKTQGSTVYPHSAAGVDPEEGVTHNVLIRDGDGVTVFEQYQFTDTSIVLPDATGAFTWTVELWSTRGEFDSLQRHQFTLDYGNNLRVTDDNSFRVTDNNDNRSVEE